MEWEAIEPAYFDSPVIKGRRIAKDREFLTSVMNIWNGEGRRSHAIETSAILYAADEDDAKTLYGQVLRRVSISNNPKENDKLPVILLFHTAAGPQDVFLYFKADVLLQNFDCLVMICDVLSDAEGWGWELDRTRYNEERASLMGQNARLLKARVFAAIQALAASVPSAAMDQIAAMGFCLGGQPILELSTLHRESRDFSVRALVTFHGVFARSTPLLIPDTTPRFNGSDHPMVLICNGDDDPFVTSKDLDVAAAFFRANGFVVEMLRVENAKHGFTNPAQDLNPDPAFGFSPNGSIRAWTKALDLLRSTILS
jgi:dienelactone hydrolase